MIYIPNRNLFEGYGEIITATVLFSLAGIFGKMISGISVQGIIFYRVTFAAVIFFIALLISGNLGKVKLKDKKIYLVLFGILQMITMLMFFISVLKSSVSVAVLLLYTAPVYVTVLSPVLLKESPAEKGLLALVLSIAGIIFIVGPEDLYFYKLSFGVLAGIISGITYASEIMISKYISQTYSGYTQAFWSFIIAILILMPAGLVPAEVIFENTAYLILLAIFPTILAVSLYFNGLKKVRASSASIMGLIEPVSAVILAVIILNEQISMLIITGGALILIGAAIVTRDE
ncbi:putative permease, DMT superfamily [Candidatus Methanoperedens nitroreducens]|uniref:Putative permease, DMT superfamily n=1 Tax=Candidatus Methanoperedens nitratireducens TaxID=1392998 RepID=A0A062V2G6_9EURY|nr:EamA family transporter [Candidatus Methanoperedens nitroreducens]KCZ71562.1 putative permease, DMT superfamily [Candidatus Methanoperedens nitroreducens]MDJ1421189.1 EamA family transporter [Candidatus Methanoperedens sp.]